MNIALIGYGKMGKAIEQVALQQGYRIVLRIGSGNRAEMTDANLKMADVAIEFTRPGSALQNVTAILKAGVPVICGTTGWNEQLPEAKAVCTANNTAFLHASNFSIGVNIFFEVNKLLARLMNAHPDYDVTVEETHHTEKKDAPSGTAITIAEQILSMLDRKQGWALKGSDHPEANLLIESFREEGMPGTHKVTYDSPVDSIEIIHTAHNREGFARGAVLAAEYISGKKGVFSMQDVLGM